MTVPRFRRGELIGLLFILVLGSWLRLYHLSQTMMFLGDQGRDALIAKAILKERDIALIGPVTSVGNMYLGPFYYYFMVPFLALTYPDPVGPALGVALTGILTIFLIYLVARSYYGKLTAMAAAFLYSIMAYAVQYSRFSWNPNLAPFFSILLFWELIQWWQTRQWKYVFLIWVGVGILAQLHYVTLITAGIAGMVMVAGTVITKQWRQLLQLFAGIGIFGLTQLPLVVFDFRHQHLIFNKFVEFFLSPEQHIHTSNLWAQMVVTSQRTFMILAELMQAPLASRINIWLTVIGLGLTIVLMIRGILSKKLRLADILIGFWLTASIIGTTFYSHVVYVHYLTFVFPIVTLFWARIITSLSRQKWLLPVSGILMISLLWFNYQGIRHMKWQDNGTSELQRTVAQTLPYITKPYNIVLLSADHDYKGMNYRYFFDTSSLRPENPDTYTGLASLVIIDEENTQKPLIVPIYEIQSSKNLTLNQSFTIPDGPRVFILKTE